MIPRNYDPAKMDQWFLDDVNFSKEIRDRYRRIAKPIEDHIRGKMEIKQVKIDMDKMKATYTVTPRKNHRPQPR